MRRILIAVDEGQMLVTAINGRAVYDVRAGYGISGLSDSHIPASVGAQ